MRERKLEVLAPAGSIDSMKAAIRAGADAVYLGGNRFGARAYADNPQNEELLEAIDDAHLHGARLYLTVNTLLKERELEGQLYDYLRPLYERGLDAVIVQDLGVLCAVREWFPDLNVHASTQMTVCGVEGVRLLEDLGVKRVVLPRELSLEEIREIREHTDLEIECFVHGALCYCYSGQCLFSSILGGRSGNRGRCAQPCRLTYDAEGGERMPLLSPKDICALDLLPQIAAAGVDSLKIEGRMKRPEYAAGTAQIYRKYADRYELRGAADYRVSDEDRKELYLLFHRDSFSEGYYRQHNGRNMMALNNLPASDPEKREQEALFARLNACYVNDEVEPKIPVSGIFDAQLGCPMSLTVTKEGLSETVTVTGQEPQKAKNRPMDRTQFEKQLKKTGNTPFVWNNLEIRMEGGLFVSVQELNQLRREAFACLEEALLHPYRRTAKETLHSVHWDGRPAKCRELHISVETEEQLDAVLRSAPALKAYADAPLTTVYVDAESLEEKLPDLLTRIRQAELQAYVALPAIFRRDTARRYEKQADRWKHLPVDGYLVRAMEEYGFLQKICWQGPWITDHNLYGWNRRSRSFWRNRGASMQTNPLELNRAELSDLTAADSVQIVYGRIPMMTTAGCLKKTLNRCEGKPGQWTLRDRYRKEFPVKNYCRDCYNIIYNSQPLCLTDRFGEVAELGVGAMRILLTTEDATETETAMNHWLSRSVPEEYTRGHFRRGVE